VGGDASAEAQQLIRLALGAPGAPAIELAGPPARLDGGRSADLFRLRIARGPAELANRDLVLRLLPMGASRAESVIHAAVAAGGYPTPAVLRAGIVEGSRSYLLMPWVDGGTLFDVLGPRRSLREVPRRLAALMLALHRLDPAPVRRALTTAGESAALDARARAIADVETNLAAIRHPARPALLEWLSRHEPPPTTTVVCHGDLHALNVLVEGATDQVVDWELAALGEPAFDVARTRLLLHAIPMQVPGAARPLLQRLGRWTARRFEAAYRSGSPLPPEAVRWYETLHAARVLSFAVADERADSNDPVAAAWRPTLPLLTATVRAATGVTLIDGRR
jgi:aminoglycoside phosphotransferase (APT) family kinase protein